MIINGEVLANVGNSKVSMGLSFVAYKCPVAQFVDSVAHKYKELETSFGHMNYFNFIIDRTPHAIVRLQFKLANDEKMGEKFRPFFFSFQT